MIALGGSYGGQLYMIIFSCAHHLACVVCRNAGCLDEDEIPTHSDRVCQ